jgi:hypothetical protein
MPTGPMAPPTKNDSRLRAQEQRRARLAAELRSNLKKRREQARERALCDAPGPAQGSSEQEQQPDAREAAKPT